MFIETVFMFQTVGFFENRKYVSYKYLNAQHKIDIKMHLMDGWKEECDCVMVM